MHVSRLFGFAAVLLSGVCAGTMDSRNGNAIVTPAPRRNVRRERCFLVMNIVSSSHAGGVLGNWPGVRVFCVPLDCLTHYEPHPERVSRIPRTLFRVRFLLAFSYQGYAKNAHPWLISLHRSAVDLHLERCALHNTENERRKTIIVTSR